jgi:hypothetical protein
MPLDGCDAHNFNCADPAILPFGCNFAMPSLQPGTYNLIVEAFQAGTEGTVTIQLAALQQNVLEICNNGIDDDMDGATDCNDLKCVTSQLCTQFQCRPDENEGLIALTGAPSASGVVQTTGAGNDQTMTSCVTMPGGHDAVVDFETPAKSNLKIEYAQIGSHVFALYSNSSNLLACDSNPLVSCTPSTMQQDSITYTNLPKGKYHLVIDAKQPGSEGGVVYQISGTIAP